MNKKAIAHLKRAYDLTTNTQQSEGKSFGDTLLIDFKPGTSVVLGEHANLADIKNISKDANFSTYELKSHTFVVVKKHDTVEAQKNGLIGLVDVYDLETGWQLQARFEYFDIIKKAPRVSGDGLPEPHPQKRQTSGDGLPEPKKRRTSGDGYLPVPEGWQPGMPIP